MAALKEKGMNRKNHIAHELEAWIRESFMVDEDDDFFGSTVNLWEEGYVDSVGVVEMISFLEKQYGVEVPKDLLFDPEFTSIAGISARVSLLLPDQKCAL